MFKKGHHHHVGKSKEKCTIFLKIRVSQKTKGKKQLKKLEQLIKKYVGKNFQAGDEFVLEDSVKAIIKCREILAKIEEEGDLIILPNKIKTKNPLYEVLKYWNARKVESLTALGLTPYARKRLSGTAEADNSEATTGRKPNNKKTTREIQDEESEEFC